MLYLLYSLRSGATGDFSLPEDTEFSAEDHYSVNVVVVGGDRVSDCTVSPWVATTPNLLQQSSADVFSGSKRSEK